MEQGYLCSKRNHKIAIGTVKLKYQFPVETEKNCLTCCKGSIVAYSLNPKVGGRHENCAIGFRFAQFWILIGSSITVIRNWSDKHQKYEDRMIC